MIYWLNVGPMGNLWPYCMTTKYQYFSKNILKLLFTCTKVQNREFRRNNFKFLISFNLCSTFDKCTYEGEPTYTSVHYVVLYRKSLTSPQPRLLEISALLINFSLVKFYWTLIDNTNSITCINKSRFDDTPNLILES